MTSQEIKDVHETAAKIGTEFMRPLVTQKEFVFIDADLLFDFKLGALLSLIRNGEKDYNYIMSHLEEYLAAPTLECAKFFPAMHATDEQLLKQYDVKENANVLAAIAPPTRFMKELGQIIQVLNTINHQKESLRPIKVTINQRLVDLHPHTKAAITAAIHRADADVSVLFTNYKTWDEVPEELLKKQDVICVYDIRDFVREGTTSQKLLATTNELAGTAIMAILQTDLKGEDAQLGTKNFVNAMQLMCEKFTFIRKTILTQKDYENGR